MFKNGTRIFTLSPWEKLEQLISEKGYASIHMLCDDNTHLHCLPYVLEKLKGIAFQVTKIAAGEQNKNLDNLQLICARWLEQGIQRNSLVICLGGGMITDLGGFCASVILRGVDCVYIPTSLMAMADASIGGKTAVNFAGYKNQLGLFHAPKAIVIDTVFLNTLDDRNMKNGFVEVIKHSLIQSPPYFKDLAGFSWPLAQADLLEYMKKSIRTKTEIIEQDYYESGIRKSLNFGHTIGHALEAYFLDRNDVIYHGEAVASGMICESYISSRLYEWKENVFENLRNYLKPFATQLQLDAKAHDAILQKMSRDKKNRDGQVQFSLLQQTGKPVLDQKVDDELILKSLDYYN